jgi:glutamate racemase
MLEQGVDCLVLGCTHYPYLLPKIRQIVGHKIQIIDSGQAVAKQTKWILEKHQLLKTDKIVSNHQFYINKDKKVLESIISKEKRHVKIDKKHF